MTETAKSLGDGFLPETALPAYTVAPNTRVTVNQIMICNGDVVTRKIFVKFSFCQDDGSYGTSRLWMNGLELGTMERIYVLDKPLNLETSDSIIMYCDGAGVVSYCITGVLTTV